MARKGTATVKPVNRNDKYIFLDSDSDEITPSATISEQSRDSSPLKRQNSKKKREASSPKAVREQLNLSSTPKPNRRRQPRQAATTVESEEKLVDEPLKPTEAHTEFSPPQSLGSQEEKPSKHPQRRLRRTSTSSNVVADAKPNSGIPKVNSAPSRQLPEHEKPYQDQQDLDYPDNMIQGGASIPTNQQRNMRACMVCSIIRTQQQFMTSGCPNCEDILELAGNSEQVNDCTSQVFEGLISISDTRRSWVARYQRLEGYVPGVYATQVEGILPEDVIAAVENAGINYVPRDGSEQEMLPKDS